MNRYNHPHKLKIRDILLRLLFVIGGITLLSFFCPRESGINLHYHLGEPWEENELIAKDSFEIYKSETQIEKERDSLKRYYEPYYEMDVEKSAELLKQFYHDFDSIAALAMLPGESGIAVKEQLRDMYKNGIVTDTDYATLHRYNITQINLFSNKEGEKASVESLHSEQSAYTQIMEQNEEIRNILIPLKVNRYIAANLAYDSLKSVNQQKEIDEMLMLRIGRVQVGEKIVDKGQIVTESIFQKLESYQRHEMERIKTPAEMWSQLGGQVLYITIMLVCLFFFLFQFRSDYFVSLRHTSLIYLMCLVFPLLTYFSVRYDWVNVYMIPYCILPIYIRIFMDSRAAFLTHVVSIMLSALAISHPFEFISIEIIAGLTAIYALKQLQQRSELFIAVVMLIFTSSLTMLCLDLVQMNFFNTKGVDGIRYISLAGGGGLVLISYLLLFPIEKLFKFTSTVTLVELSNINHPILRRLSEEAPGTFQHSMQVANLASEVANRLDANAMLVRTAALYHDIGKLKDPVFFTENQSGVNPHNNYAFEDSAQIIIQHVKYGLELANKYNLPPAIKTFISSHHGRSKTKFFYISYINQNPDKAVNDEIFTYPGPNPKSLEEAVLMMADSVEAASRSLPEYTEESVSNLVDKIIDGQVQEGYFNLCPITFENIATCKRVFKEKLKSIYHTRIVYPELKK